MTEEKERLDRDAVEYGDIGSNIEREEARLAALVEIGYVKLEGLLRVDLKPEDRFSGLYVRARREGLSEALALRRAEKTRFAELTKLTFQSPLVGKDAEEYERLRKRPWFTGVPESEPEPEVEKSRFDVLAEKLLKSGLEEPESTEFWELCKPLLPKKAWDVEISLADLNKLASISIGDIEYVIDVEGGK